PAPLPLRARPRRFAFAPPRRRAPLPASRPAVARLDGPSRLPSAPLVRLRSPTRVLAGLSARARLPSGARAFPAARTLSLAQPRKRGRGWGGCREGKPAPWPRGGPEPVRSPPCPPCDPGRGRG
ncbi:hypothetical protein P7K49_032704, partial [Saguinus oedipus]